MGLIKHLFMTLNQISTKSIVMNVVVAEIPPKFGMLLSRSWASKLKGTLQMDMSYTTILVFGEKSRSWREKQLEYVVSSQEKPQNHLICVGYIDIGSSIF